MLDTLLIILALLVACYGTWQTVFVKPTRADLRLMLDKVNGLRTLHELLSKRKLPPPDVAISPEVLSRLQTFTDMYDEFFLPDLSENMNRNLSAAAKGIFREFKDIRMERLRGLRVEFSIDLFRREDIPLGLRLSELSIMIEYAIKKVPYYPSRFLNYGMWLASIRRKKSL